MEATEKTLKARHDAYLDGMESLNKTLLATLQDNDITGMLTADSASHTAATLAAADMLCSKLTALDKSIQNLSVLVGRLISK